jgi:Family of unknown function (DUF6492)
VGNKRYTFTTVVFEQEYDLLLLQARSMRIYCDRSLLDKVIVIDNSRRALPEIWLKKLLDEYGDISGIVRVLRPEKFSRLPRSKGWTSQQILKLAVSRIIATDRYVILDAKNHLISPLVRDYLESPSGLARICPRGPYVSAHPLRPHLERTLAYFRLEQERHLANFTGATTPFTMHTHVAHQLIESVENDEGVSFEETFVEHQLTEFFSYASHIIRRGIEMETLYDLNQPPSRCLWIEDANLWGCQRVIAAARDGSSPFFAAHKAAISKLPADARKELAAFWSSRLLFESNDAANTFLLRLRAKLIMYALTKPIRKLPHSVRKRFNRLFSKVKLNASAPHATASVTQADAACIATSSDGRSRIGRLLRPQASRGRIDPG